MVKISTLYHSLFKYSICRFQPAHVKETKIMKFSPDLGEFRELPENPSEITINHLVAVGSQFYQTKQTCLQDRSPEPVDPIAHCTDILRQIVAAFRCLSKIHDCTTTMRKLLTEKATVLSDANEFIVQMADAVRNKIIEEIKQSKYFSIIFDCTPEVSFEGEISIVVRYVFNDVIRERLLDTLSIFGVAKGSLARVMVERLRSYGVDFKNCRGISYDNFNHLAGHYNLVETNVKGDSPTAIFSPVAAHSLNLVLENDANCLYSGRLFKITKTVADFVR
jgi:hypothetical protein